MELRHLRYFVAVARAGNFTRAAHGLGIQQPPLSQQVRSLENELGYALFHRLPRGVALTTGGAVFLVEAEAILEKVDQGVRRAAQAAQGAAGSLSLGFTSSAVTHLFTPRLLRLYRASSPQVEITIQVGNAAALSAAVAGGRLDAAMIRRPVSEHSGLDYHTVANERLLVALPIGHRLAERARRRGGAPVRIRDLADESFILVRSPGAHGMYGDLISACHKAGFAPKVVAEVDQMLTNIALVAGGFGVSVVPASMRNIHAKDIYHAEPADAPQLLAPLNLVSRIGETSPTAERFVRFTIGLSRSS